jgi:pimeloyl-ACP methyl ester carboxylesterase
MAVKNLVMLRGLMREKGHWGDFPQRVQEILPGVNVLLVDLPGVGEHARERPPFRLFSMAQEIHEEVKAQTGGEGPTALLGLSLGGMVALEMMGVFEGFYEKVMVVNTSSRLSPSTKRLRRQVWPSFLKLVTQLQGTKREELLVPHMVNSPEGREQALHVWMRVAKDQKFHPLAPVAQLKAAASFLPPSSLKDSERVLLISSLGDLFVDPSCSELLHKKYGWKHHVHPWGGHDLIWDDPQWLLQEIHSFFS